LQSSYKALRVLAVVLVESKSAARSVIDAFSQLVARIDSGAQTSSIHAFRPRFSQKDDGEWVSFETHPRRRSRKDAVRVKAKVKTRRIIRSSNVKSELRPMIETTMTMGGETFVSELTLENRFLMAYRMILGRSAMRGRFTIDPSKSYLFGE
jgi:ribosomal protein S6--L-glutamate ligase